MMAQVFITTDNEIFMECLFGPSQHDAHMRCWRWHKMMVAQNRNYLAEIAARQAAKRAAGIGAEGLCRA